jgi:hypothetical protein
MGPAMPRTAIIGYLCEVCRNFNKGLEDMVMSDEVGGFGESLVKLIPVAAEDRQFEADIGGADVSVIY